MTNHILRIDASLRHTSSITRGLLDRVTDVTFITADALMMGTDVALTNAHDQIDALAA